MTDSHPDDWSFGSNAEASVFAEFEIQDYVENPPLIHVLRASVDNIQAANIQLRRQESAAQRRLEKTRKELAEATVRHEKERGDLKEQLARLKVAESALQSQITELRRLSAIAVLIAWLGTVLVAVGVNILTSDSNQPLGTVFILTGATLEVAAIFIRKHSGVQKP